MRRLLWVSCFAFLLLCLSCGGGSQNYQDQGGSSNPPPPVTSGGYALTVWSELGMHCMDGKDYSIASILPPYNTIHAQLIKQTEPPQIISSGVTLTYQAIPDTNSSTNTSSASKTNFWTYVNALFHASPAANVGLAGYAVQSNSPQQMQYNSQLKAYEAVGIPTVPYDDIGNRNAYPMALVVAKDAQGNTLAQSKVVLAVSDEMSCNTCHASNSNAAARPSLGWVNNADALKDVKLNILRRHDDNYDISTLLPALKTAGYTYQSTLEQTAISGTPVLCAACHATNALGAPGVAGVSPVTAAMHGKHATVVNPNTGRTLDNATSPSESCYLCHPGLQTKCQRGAMNAVACYDCHGNLSKVGDPTRQGWLDVPNCQMCHNSSTRYSTTFSSPGVWRTTTDTTFATTPNVPVAGKSLFRYSSGHGGVYCSACHGSPHAEFPTIRPNDNVYSTELQGYSGRLTECSLCHNPVPTTQNGGPHGMHTIGQAWVNAHHNYASNGRYTQCAYCHGSNYRGTALSQIKYPRSFQNEGRTVNFTAGTNIGCYDCHNGPNGG